MNIKHDFLDNSTNNVSIIHCLCKGMRKHMIFVSNESNHKVSQSHNYLSPLILIRKNCNLSPPSKKVFRFIIWTHATCIFVFISKQIERMPSRLLDAIAFTTQKAEKASETRQYVNTPFHKALDICSTYFHR